MKDGDLLVPCSRWGRNTSDCAEVAWRLAYLVWREGGDEMGPELLDWAMGLVVNDSDGVSDFIRRYGNRKYR